MRFGLRFGAIRRGISEIWAGTSFIGDMTRWSLILLAAGLALTIIVAEVARRSTASNLADFELIDFLSEDIGQAITLCPQDDAACFTQVYQNETGGIWRIVDKAGRAHASFSFSVSAFSERKSDCNTTESRIVGAFTVFTCEVEGIRYRIAQAPPHGFIALEVLDWTRRRDRALNHRASWRSFDLAIVVMSLTLIGVLATALWILRSRMSRHFNRLSNELAVFRSGIGGGFSDGYPDEIQALVDRFNAALAKNSGLIERQRRNVNKMAHDMRHQLVTIDLAARSENRDELQAELSVLNALVERYLTLVDWVGPIEGAQQTKIAPVIEAIQQSFSRRLRLAPVTIVAHCDQEMSVQIHITDLHIILSNLMMNAHKFAKSRIEIGAMISDGALVLTVTDDGPGIPEAEREAVVGWGTQLDHARPGSGFGLAIVAEQVRELYQGEMRLEVSTLGGLAAIVRLPL
jgi:signal transduction histidine kinase